MQTALAPQFVLKLARKTEFLSGVGFRVMVGAGVGCRLRLWLGLGLGFGLRLA